MIVKTIAAGLISLAVLCTSAAAEAGDGVIRIGVLTDLSSFASTSMGPGSVTAAQLAVKDFGGTVLGRKIEVISADMQSKPDLAVDIARRWYDTEAVDVIIDVPASAAAITIQGMALAKNRLFIATVAATTDLTGKACSPRGVHWGNDSAAMSRGLVNAMAKGGARTWFLIMPDYAIGKAIAGAAQARIEAGGGRVLGRIFYPPNSTDYAQYLLQAQQSAADVIGVGNIGIDLSTLIKQAGEFGIVPSSRQKLAAFVMNLSDIHAVGLKTMQGVYIVQDFYWDTNEATRAFAKAFFAVRGAMPNYTHASNYSGVLAYLNAVREAGTDDPAAVVARMRKAPMSRFGAAATLRADGRVVNAVGLYRIKSPAESQMPWDYLTLERTIPGDQAFLSMAEGACPLVGH